MWCLLYCKVWFRPGRLHIDVMVFTIKFSLIVTMYAYAVSLSFVPQITSPWDHWLHEWQWVSVVLLFQVRKLKKEKKNIITLVQEHRKLKLRSVLSWYSWLQVICGFFVFTSTRIHSLWLVIQFHNYSVGTENSLFFPGALTKLP